MFNRFCDTAAEKNLDKRVEMQKFTAVREVLCNKWFYNLIGPYHILY